MNKMKWSLKYKSNIGMLIEKVWFLKFLLYNIITFLFLSYIMNFIERVLANIGVLKVFELDLVPGFSSNNFWIFLIIAEIIFFLIVLLFIEYKLIVIKYRCIFGIAIFILEIFVLYKYDGDYLPENGLALLIAYCMINYISLERYIYSDNALKKKQSLNVETSVVGRENLQKVQEKALNQIISAIDNLEPEDSMNIALIGAWGRGKTSIIDTLICEKEKYDYFILKINALSMGQISNIIQYVNDYLSLLFRKYIPFSFAQWDNSYFSILAELFEENKFINYGKKILNSMGKHEFIENEFERTVLSRRIQKLLKKTKKKKIVLIIDDVDRTNMNEEIIKLLSEFSAIEGIICLISLGDKYDISYRPIKQNGYERGVKCLDGSINCFEQIDKFIQLRISIELEETIEYEATVKNEILNEHKLIKYNRREYINCYNMRGSRPFLFGLSITHNYNNSKILTEIFLENLQEKQENLGDALEEMITEYYRNCYPIFHYFEKNIPEMENEVLQEGRAAWNFENYHGNWMTILISQATMMIKYLEWLIQGTVNNNSSSITLNSIDTLLEFGQKIDYRNYSEANKVVAKYHLNMIFSDDEQTIISKFVEEKNFDEVRKKLDSKYDEVCNFLQKAYLLEDFIIYIRNIMNNFRTLKMQLREAKILNLNYLDYLLENYEGSSKIKEKEKNLKDRFPYLSEKQFFWNGLYDLVQDMIFNKYISGYGKKLNDSKFLPQESIIWIGELEKKKFIIYSGIEIGSGKLENIIMDISGEVVTNKLTDEERDKFIDKTFTILENEIVDINSKFDIDGKERKKKKII